MGNFIDKLQISGSTYDIKDSSAATVVDILQADYDALPESAKTSSTIIYNVTDAPAININDYVSKAQNVVPAGYMYSKVETTDYTTPESMKVQSVKIYYTGSSTNDRSFYAFLLGTNGFSANVYMTVNFTNGTLTQSNTDRLDYTFDENEKSFTVYIKDEFSASTWYYILNYSHSADAWMEVGFFPIGGAQTAQVVSGDVSNAIAYTANMALNSFKNLGFSYSKNSLNLYGTRNSSDQGSTLSQAKFVDIVYDNGRSAFKTDIQVPTGEKAWTTVYSGSQACTLYDINLPRKFRLVNKIEEPWNFASYWTTKLTSDGGVYNFSESITVVNDELTLRSNLLNSVGSGVTFTYDSTANTVTVEYADKVEYNGYEWEITMPTQMSSTDCTFGSYITIEGYADVTEGIIPYVQGKQDTLVSGTNIKTINNQSILGSGNLTIGGGTGGTEYTAGDGIDITNQVISVTGQVASSAITTAVTTASTDSEIPTAKAVNDAIAAGGGGSITIDPSLDSGSTNPVSNSAITNAINSKVSDISFDTDMGVKRFLRFSTPNSFNKFLLQNFKINGTPVLKDGYTTSDGLDNYNLVPSSAITTSITSSSTDAQVPSAKAVYGQLGGMKIVKLTESEYTALVTKDADTLYVVIPDPSN